MNYEDWKLSILKKIQSDTQGGLNLELYWPESNNFKKINSPFVRENNKIYCCKTLGASTQEEVENFIENSSNIGIYYIEKSNDLTYGFKIRVIDFDQDELTGVTVEDFYEKNSKELSSATTTIEEIKEKMSEVKDLDFIYVKTRKKINSDPTLCIQKFVTDGDMIYV